MSRHAPFWLDRFPKSRRRSHPPFRGELETDVIVIGGGLTGCACASSFAAAGIKTVVLEADRIGAGSTAASLGLIREDFDASFQDDGRRIRPAGCQDAVAGAATRLARFRGGDQAAEHPVRSRAAGSAARGAAGRGRGQAVAARVRRASRGGLRPHVDDRRRARAGGSSRRGRRDSHARLRVRSVSRVPGLCRIGGRRRGAVLFERSPCPAHSREPQARRCHRRDGHGARAGGRHRDRCFAPRSARAPAPSASPARATPSSPSRCLRRCRRELGRRAARAARQREPAAFPALAEGRSRDVRRAPTRRPCRSARATRCSSSARDS